MYRSDILETVNLLISYDDFKEQYNRYMDQKNNFIKLKTSHSFYTTKHSIDIIDLYKQDMLNILAELKQTALRLKDNGIQSKLIDIVINQPSQV